MAFFVHKKMMLSQKMSFFDGYKMAKDWGKNILEHVDSFVLDNKKKWPID